MGNRENHREGETEKGGVARGGEKCAIETAGQLYCNTVF